MEKSYTIYKQPLHGDDEIVGGTFNNEYEALEAIKNESPEFEGASVVLWNDRTNKLAASLKWSVIVDARSDSFDRTNEGVALDPDFERDLKTSMDQSVEDEIEFRVAPELKNEPAEFVQTPSAAIASEVPDTRFAVNAPYWLNGLHNKAGLALAEEINKEVSSRKLQEEQEAIEQILANYQDAQRFGLAVISEKKHLDDPHRKMNLAEPKSLLENMFVRDKEGAYRPAAGGRPILLDKGDSLVLKNKDSKSYEAAVELARSKGWTAISLKGKPAMMEQAWIAAKLAGIEVTNYTPTKEAKAKFADRLAEQQVSNITEINRAPTEPSVSSGNFEGKILRLENGQAIQKTGRDPDVTVHHDISKLSKTLVVGDVVSIKYDKDGHGIVEDKAKEKALGR